MLSLPPSVRVYVCARPTDMRRSFDGLSMMAQEVLREDPFSGHLFVFFSRRRDRVKVLYWDRAGLAIWAKRLEQGTFRLPPMEGMDCLEIEAVDLAFLLQGIDLNACPPRRRYCPRAVPA